MSANTVPPRATGAARAAAAGIRRHALAHVLLRLTGVLLAVLVCGHFAVMHLANDVATTGSTFVARRWSQALWVSWDWVMLAAALLHGAIGLNTAASDYTTGRRRRLVRAGLVAATVTLFAFGSVVIALGAGT
jgi:succinate dehydrogenase / fumarate reductase, membrane anchor subunit